VLALGDRELRQPDAVRDTVSCGAAPTTPVGTAATRSDQRHDAAVQASTVAVKVAVKSPSLMGTTLMIEPELASAGRRRGSEQRRETERDDRHARHGVGVPGRRAVAPSVPCATMLGVLQDRDAPRRRARTDTPSSKAWRRAVSIVMGVLVVATLVGMVALWPGEFEISTFDGAPQGEPIDARVTAVAEVPCQMAGQEGCRVATAELEGGGRAEFQADAAGGNELVEVGDRVLLYENPVAPGADPDLVPPYAFSGFERTSPLLWLAAAFVVIVVALGRWRGLRSLLGLAVSLLIVAKFVVPAILSGRNAVAVAIVGAIAVMLVTIVLTHGVGPKSLAALLGTTASLGLTVALAAVFTELANLSGFASDQSTLLALGQEQLSLQGLVLAGMVIGPLGVLDDVTVSQASTVMALRAANPGQQFKQLYSGALSVGRDHVAATVNTLVLAYVGAALPTVLIFSVAGSSLTDGVNTESIAQDIVATLVGSIGLIAAVPITTALAALFATRLPAREVARAGAGGHAH